MHRSKWSFTFPDPAKSGVSTLPQSTTMAGEGPIIITGQGEDKGGENPMPVQSWPRVAGLVLGILVMTAGAAAPTASRTKSRRPASCGSGSRSARPAARSGRPGPKPAAMPGCRSISARKWRRNSACPLNMSCSRIPARSPTPPRRAPGMSPGCRRTRSARPGCRSGPVYEVTDATYIVKSGSSVTNFQTLDQPGIRVAAVKQHHHHARRAGDIEECEGHGLPDL